MANEQEACEQCGGSKRIYVTEDDMLGQLKAEQGTGRSITFNFGFSGPGRVWQPCPACATSTEKQS